MNPLFILFLTSLVLAGILWVQLTTSPEKLPISEFVEKYNQQVYKKIEVKDQKVKWFLEVPSKLWSNQEEEYEISILPVTDRLTDLWFFPKDADNPTPVEIIDTKAMHFWSNLAPTLIGLVIFVGLGVLLLTKMMQGWGGPMAFAKSRAKLYQSKLDKITFKDVAGCDEEKDDLVEFVDFLKNPNKYKKLGAKIPRWVLMVGPPGTGKTLLARAVAGESDVPFYSISGSEFVEMFVWVGASRVRDLFKEAREKAPAIIFIDEIDAIGKKRSPGFWGGHDEREQTLNQILTEMDGFENDTNVIVMGATNRADVLDKALLRPGRFDRKVTINLPGLEDRKAILKVHAKNKPLAKDVDFHALASTTVWFAGADLENLLNEWAILAGREKAKKITQKMLQQSIEKIVMGNTKKSRVMSEFEKKITAYHEVGHALVGIMTKHADPVHKISIVSRGSAGWVTWFLPEKDKIYVTKAKLLDELTVFFAGRAAEEIFFGKDYVTTGASSDIERATDIARDMIMRYGFDEEVGMMNTAGRHVSGNHLGSVDDGEAISDEFHNIIDNKVRTLLKEAYDEAKSIINKHKDLHEKISLVLIEKEEMLKEEFERFFEWVDIPEKVGS